MFAVPLVGAHNVRNALAAIAVGRECGIALETLRAGLAAFRGVKRRLEVVGTQARHRGLRRLRASSDGGRRNAGGAARRAARSAHLGDLRAALGLVLPARVSGRLCARVCARPTKSSIASVFRSSLPPERAAVGRSAGRAIFARRGVSARHLPDVETIVRDVSAEARARRLVVVMSNGGFGGIHGKLLEALRMTIRARRATRMLLVEWEQTIDPVDQSSASSSSPRVCSARLGHAVRDIVPGVLLASAFTSIRC